MTDVLKQEASKSMSFLEALTWIFEVPGRIAEIRSAAYVIRKHELYAALKMCSIKFKEYAKIHRAKNSFEGVLKAVRNDEMVSFCETVLYSPKKSD